jgi:hypothetical protein
VLKSEQVSAAMTILRIKAKSTGRRVSWAGLKENRLVAPPHAFATTVTLPDVITDVQDLCNSIDPDWRIITLYPNHWLSASLDLVFVGRGYKVVCARRLTRGWFPFNFFAAEFGKNYDVVMTINADSSETEARFLTMLKEKYECTVFA